MGGGGLERPKELHPKSKHLIFALALTPRPQNGGECSGEFYSSTTGVLETKQHPRSTSSMGFSSLSHLDDEVQLQILLSSLRHIVVDTLESPPLEEICPIKVF